MTFPFYRKFNVSIIKNAEISRNIDFEGWQRLSEWYKHVSVPVMLIFVSSATKYLSYCPWTKMHFLWYCKSTMLCIISWMILTFIILQKTHKCPFSQVTFLQNCPVTPQYYCVLGYHQTTCGHWSLLSTYCN